MCISKPKAPPPVPPPPPPPPPVEPPKLSIASPEDAKNATSLGRNKGRNALRIDLTQNQASSGSGLNLPLS